MLKDYFVYMIIKNMEKLQLFKFYLEDVYLGRKGPFLIKSPQRVIL